MQVERIRNVLNQRVLDGRAPIPAAQRAFAAVAVVLREGARGAEVLFIERATREGDPWSGHMAFPGGRLEGADDSPRTAACRETLEEVGLEISGAEYLGHVCDLTDGRGTSNPIIVSAHAFHLAEHQSLSLDEKEVRSAFWFPLEDLHDAARRTTFRLPQLPDHVFQAIVVGEPGRHFVWGLTFRFLDQMFTLAGRPLARV